MVGGRGLVTACFRLHLIYRFAAPNLARAHLTSDVRCALAEFADEILTDVAKSGTLTFAPGETMKPITIVVKGDSKKEADETFYLELFGNSSNSLFAKERGIGTILNDD